MKSKHKNLIPLLLMIAGVVVSGVFMLWNVPYEVFGIGLSPLLCFAGTVMAAIGGWTKKGLEARVEGGTLILD